MRIPDHQCQLFSWRQERAEFALGVGINAPAVSLPVEETQSRLQDGTGFGINHSSLQYSGFFAEFKGHRCRRMVGGEIGSRSVRARVRVKVVERVWIAVFILPGVELVAFEFEVSAKIELAVAVRHDGPERDVIEDEPLRHRINRGGGDGNSVLICDNTLDLALQVARLRLSRLRLGEQASGGHG